MSLPLPMRHRRRILQPRVRLLCVLLPAVTGLALSAASTPDVELTYDSAGPASPSQALAIATLALLLLVLGARRHHHQQDPPAWDLADLADWHPAHRDPAGDVWAVKPPFGYRTWKLYAPGSPAPGPYHYEGVEPAARKRAPDRDGERLADVERWVRPWVEQATGGRVVEMAEGWGEPYGPDGDLLEYVIYARVAHRLELWIVDAP